MARGKVRWTTRWFLTLQLALYLFLICVQGSEDADEALRNRRSLILEYFLPINLPSAVEVPQIREKRDVEGSGEGETIFSEINDKNVESDLNEVDNSTHNPFVGLVDEGGHELSVSNITNAEGSGEVDASENSSESQEEVEEEATPTPIVSEPEIATKEEKVEAATTKEEEESTTVAPITVEVPNEKVPEMVFDREEDIEKFTTTESEESTTVEEETPLVPLVGVPKTEHKVEVTTEEVETTTIAQEMPIAPVEVKLDEESSTVAPEEVAKVDIKPLGGVVAEEVATTAQETTTTPPEEITTVGIAIVPPVVGGGDKPDEKAESPKEVTTEVVEEKTVAPLVPIVPVEVTKVEEEKTVAPIVPVEVIKVEEEKTVAPIVPVEVTKVEEEKTVAPIVPVEVTKVEEEKTVAPIVPVEVIKVEEEKTVAPIVPVEVTEVEEEKTVAPIVPKVVKVEEEKTVGTPVAVTEVVEEKTADPVIPVIPIEVTEVVQKTLEVAPTMGQPEATPPTQRPVVEEIFKETKIAQKTLEALPGNILQKENMTLGVDQQLIVTNTRVMDSEETVQLSSSEPKRIGAYIVIGLILLSFSSLVGYIAFRKRMNRKRQDFESNPENLDTEKALLSLTDYKDNSELEENHLKNNEITPIVVKSNSQINKFEKNTNFSSPKNLNTIANEKNIEKDNVLKSTAENLTQVIIEDSPKDVEEDKNVPNTEKLIVRTRMDQDSIPKKPILINRSSGGYIPIPQDNL